MFERWAEVELDLRVEATMALDDGRTPAAMLVAFDEHAPVSVVELRPMASGELLQALVEVISLLLPLGARRLALALPGQVREEHAAPSAADAQVGDGPLLVVASADGAGTRPASLRARVLPLTHDGTCWQWREDGEVEIDAAAWDVTRALGVLLDAPRRLLGTDAQERRELQAQLARCLLLGHVVVLAPGMADRLEPARRDQGAADLSPPG